MLIIIKGPLFCHTDGSFVIAVYGRWKSNSLLLFLKLGRVHLHDAAVGIAGIAVSDLTRRGNELRRLPPLLRVGRGRTYLYMHVLVLIHTAVAGFSSL